jgi:hypothetical protein
MTTPTPERIAAALALAEASVKYLNQLRHPTDESDFNPVESAIDAYRATAPKLRTRAEVDAEIATVMRVAFGAGSVQVRSGAVNMTSRLEELCDEPLAPDPQPYGSSSDRVDSPPRVDAAAGATFNGPRPTPATKESSDTAGVDAGAANRITDHDADQREPLEDPEACGCEQSDDLKDRLQECRRLLRFVFDRAKEIRQALETIP